MFVEKLPELGLSENSTHACNINKVSANISMVCGQSKPMWSHTISTTLRVVTVGFIAVSLAQEMVLEHTANFFKDLTDFLLWIDRVNFPFLVDCDHL